MAFKKSNESVKVGDIFVASWGYGQTNVNAFQVVSLAGKTSVVLREVEKEKVFGPNETEADRQKYMCGSCKPAPGKFRDFSVLIEDQEKGSRKQVSVDDAGTIAVKVGGGDYWAFKWDGARQYRESWYY